jgi:glycosyltransferase involved in cell wall biosynthesis
MDIFLHSSATLNIVNELADLGHDVNLLSARSKKVAWINNDRVHTFFVPLRFIPVVSSLMFSVILFFFLPFFIILSKPDYVILDPSVSLFGFLSGQLVSRFRKVKFIMDIRSIPVETKGLRGSATEFLYSLSVITARNVFDGVTTLTDLMKKEICQRFDIEPTSVGVWTSGVSEILFNPENLSFYGAKLREKLGFSKKFVVFYHGVFTANRGLMETIESIKSIRHKHPDIVFFLLGTGPIFSLQETLIQKENLQENVILHKPVPHTEVPKFIAMCDVGIIPLPHHPYWNSQNPIKLLEYLAMEKVVILTNIPAHTAVIDEAKCGIYITSIKANEIADAIEYAYVNRKKLKNWGKIGRKIVKKKYTWKSVANNLESYLSSIRNE